MPQIHGFTERPHYNSVEAYLTELAKDVAEMVIDHVKMKRFREQLDIYVGFWKQWTTADKADRQGCWVPQMGRPECIFNIFSRSYNPLREEEKESKRLAGSYALCALIHDRQLPHLDKINKDIIPTEAIKETLSAPRNTLEARGIWHSGPNVDEIYLIEEFFNYVKVDLQEFCKSEENKLKQATIEGQIQQANELSDAEFFKLTAKIVEGRAKKVLSKEETWYDLDRSLKGWFDAAIERLKKNNFTENEIGLYNYIYKNLQHYARGINIKNFRGFPDSRIVELATKTAFELANKFKDIASKTERFKKNKVMEIQEEFTIHQGADGTAFVIERESLYLEFKETLEFDIGIKEKNPELIKSSLKTIAAFLNTEGGTLLIGISDNGEVKGLERDFRINKGNEDGFEQKLRSLISSRFNPRPFGSVQIAFEELYGHTICRINVKKRFEAILFDKDFYIRDGNCTRKLEAAQDIVNWINQKSNKGFF
ncbi:MAG: ATP-binding protein [Sedimentisphaerales bacterium]|nr:ATP-binding protein [Sedimentisphaerales bacterium]